MPVRGRQRKQADKSWRKPACRRASICSSQRSQNRRRNRNLPRPKKNTPAVRYIPAWYLVPRSIKHSTTNHNQLVMRRVRCVSVFFPTSTRYTSFVLCMRVRVVFLEHGALGICKSSVCTCSLAVCTCTLYLCPLVRFMHIVYSYYFLASKRCGWKPPAELSAWDAIAIAPARS